jgi:hypothetical protein
MTDATDDASFIYVNCPLTRQMLIQGYHAVKALDMVALFRKPISETVIFSETFKNLCNYIEDNDGPQHSGASFGAVCRELNIFFSDPEKHRNLWQTNQRAKQQL